MGNIEIFKYLLLFITLANVQCQFVTGRWKLTKTVCPREEDIDDCGCERGEGDIKKLHCGYSYDLEEYLSRINNTYDIERTNFDLLFYKISTEVPSKIFNGFKIKTLTIDTCNVTKWRNEEQEPAFIGLENELEVLNIRESIFQLSKDPDFPDHDYIKRNKFPFNVRHLRKLKFVTLRKNSLFNFCNMFGSGSEDTLEGIYLEFNKINHVCDGEFSNLKQLKVVNLSENQLRTISRSVFPNPATHLKEILINFNKLRVLPKDLFENMPALKFLELTYNHDLKVLDESTFKPVWSQLIFFNFNVCCLRCDDKRHEWIIKERSPKILSGDCYRFEGKKEVTEALFRYIEQKRKELEQQHG